MTERPVSRMTSDPGGRAFWRSSRGRIVLSALFVLHWGAVATLVLRDTGSQPALPAALRPAFERVLMPIGESLWPAASAWLDVTSTRQQWMLFAPAPSDWSVTVIAIPSYAGVSPDTLVVPGPGQDPFPHWDRPRSYDLAFNLAYEGTGTFYRTLEARRLCDGLRRAGRAPASVALNALWTPLDPPWRSGARAPLYRPAGRFDCAVVLTELPRPNS